MSLSMCVRMCASAYVCGYDYNDVYMDVGVWVALSDSNGGELLWK